ncbi:hypothetical protein ABZ512_08800 [Nocardiopsis dassonvillei]|uniref:hypothetical protein n=1 Tax=Nocardiopsis dassonvillei TaxID=2014 RepID=UPI0033EFCE89
MRGTAWYRSSTKLSRTERVSARAAVSVTVQRLAEKGERRSFPDIDQDVEERLTIALTPWQEVDAALHPDLRIRARVSLRLEKAARARLEEYHSARRRAHTELAVLSDRIAHFQQYVLHDADTARAWWLDRHDTSVESSKVFDAVIMPLVHHRDDPQSRHLRAANVFASVLERLGTDEVQHRMFVAWAHSVLDHMGWNDLAEGLKDPSAFAPQKNVDFPTEKTHS